MWIPIVALAAACLVLWAVLKLVVVPARSPLNAVPGPPSNFLFGNMREITREATMAPHWRWFREYGQPPLLHYHTLFNKSSLIVLDADMARDIVLTKRHMYPKNYWQLKPFLGNGLVTLDGEEWHRHRKIAQPAFTSIHIRALVENIVVPCARSIIPLWSKMAEAGTPLKLNEHLSLVTLDVIGKAAFDHDFGAVRDMGATESGGEGDVLKRLFFENLRTPVTLLTILLGPLVNYLRFIPMVRKRQDAMAALNQAVEEIVQAKRSQLAELEKVRPSSDEDDDEQEVVQRRNFISLLFSATDDDGHSLSDQSLRDEAKTFILAGHETTSTLCTWTFLALTQYPEVCTKLVAEIDEVVGGCDAVPTVALLKKMPYLDAVVKEVLRFYPPVPMVIRFSAVDDTLGEQRVPAGTRVLLPIMMLHRLERYWDEPEQFRPERWMGDATPYRHPFAYMPFMAGARNCIGQQFARLEAKMIIVTLLQNFLVSIAPDQKDTVFEFTTFITMMPKPLPQFVLTARH